jgi:hypothetical protein
MTDTRDATGAPPGAEVDRIAARVVAIWQGVLREPDLGPDSHLLSTGATSLTAVRIQSRIRAEFGKDIDLIDLLEHPTPRDLAPVIAAAGPWQGLESWRQLDWADDDGTGELAG